MHSDLVIISHSALVLCIHYKDCHGWSSIITMHKEVFSFHFQFQFNLTSNDIKMDNMSKSNCIHENTNERRQVNVNILQIRMWNIKERRNIAQGTK